MTTILEARNLGKAYGRRWALQDCTLDLPAGHVTGLVGPNGAGKTTLLNLAAGILSPSTGTIEVCGERPAINAVALAKVGFVPQNTPVFATLTVAEHLELGARLNLAWDDALARRRVDELRLDPKQRADRLSGGQRAQLVLTLALAKRPALLILDEPVASLDPLARREFLQGLMEAVADNEMSVVLSSHLVSDLERVCDHIIVLVDSKVRVAADVETLLDTHYRLVGPRRATTRLSSDQHLVEARNSDRQSIFIVRTEAPIADPAWSVSPIGLEDLLLAYVSQSTDGRSGRPLEGAQ